MNRYWSAIECAVVRREQIEPFWGGTLHAPAIMNCAFRLYYDAFRQIGVLTGEEATARRRALLSCARSGFGVGVHDLEDAFEHLLKNSGRSRGRRPYLWTDAASAQYETGRNKVFPASGPSALAAVNFLNAVDVKMGEFAAGLEGFYARAQRIREEAAAARWEAVGEVLDDVTETAEAISEYAWFAPDSIRDAAGRVATYSGVLARIHEFLSLYRSSREAGLSTDAAAGVAALQQAVSVLPVLGEFYGRAVEMIPGLVAWYRSTVQSYLLRLDREIAPAMQDYRTRGQGLHAQ